MDGERLVPSFEIFATAVIKPNKWSGRRKMCNSHLLHLLHGNFGTASAALPVPIRENVQVTRYRMNKEKIGPYCEPFVELCGENASFNASTTMRVAITTGSAHRPEKIRESGRPNHDPFVLIGHTRVLKEDIPERFNELERFTIFGNHLLHLIAGLGEQQKLDLGHYTIDFDTSQLVF